MQLSLFEEEKQKPTQKEDYRKCKSCKEDLPLSMFQVDVQKYGVNGKETIYYKTSCIPCNRKLQQMRISLRKENPKPDHNICSCCGEPALAFREGKSRPYLVLDHCHDTHKFRGWLCQKCNVGLGSLGDNIEGLEKGIKYLRKFEDKIK